MDGALAEAFITQRDAIAPDTPSLKEPFDLLSELQRVRGVLQHLLASSKGEEIPPEHLEEAIHSLGLSKRAIETVTDVCREHCEDALRLADADARLFDQERGRKAIANLYRGDEWAMDGATFLQGIFDRGERVTRMLKPDRSHIARLERMVSETFGQEYEPLVYVLFNFMGRDVKRITALVETQCRAHAAQADAAEPQHIFGHLSRFLRVYGDVSAYVIEQSEDYGHAGKPRSKQEAERRAATGISRVLHNPTLQTNAAAPVDLFETLSETFSEEPKHHPWFWGNLRDSPYAAEYVNGLLSFDMPRSVLAKTLVALNAGGTDQENIPDEVAVRILDPRKILLDVPMAHGADRLLARLQRPPKPDAREGWKKPVLRRSLDTVLHRDDPGRLLDVPLRSGKYRDWTLRDLLMKVCFTHFEEDEIEERAAPSARSLFPLVENERMHTSSAEHLNNFNAAGVGTIRDHFLESASATLSLQKGTNRFEWATRYVERALDMYYHTGGNYEYFCYGSATSAFEAFLQQQFPNLKPGDNIVMPDQEYDLLPRYFQHRCGSGGVRTVALRHPTEKRLRTEEELLAEFEQVIDPQTHLILISSKTRFGEAPCSRWEGDRPNTHYLRRLIQTLRERHPTTFIALDGAQSIGRAVPEQQLLEADLFLGSGAKALGVGEMGFIALRNRFAESFEYRPSMLPLDHIVAMGMVLNNHCANRENLRRMEGNFGEQGNQEGWYNVARHMRHLTTRALQKSQSHGETVLKWLQSMNVKGLAERLREVGSRCGGEEGLKRLFGCEVLSPYHCNPRDYVGILTLLFPNMKGEQMAQELARPSHGMQALPCRHRNRALRVSFHYDHSAEDVDRLFEAMAETQCHIAARDVQEGNPWREVYDLAAPSAQA